jgi:hypothetical protein
MESKNASDQSSWKVFFRDAVFELEPYRLREKLKAARNSIEDRLLKINSHAVPDELELQELADAQQTLTVLQARNTG